MQCNGLHYCRRYKEAGVCESVCRLQYGFYCYSGLIMEWIIPATEEADRCGNRTAAAVF